jgi:transcriptional regulator with XRE-family HTH domain
MTTSPPPITLGAAIVAHRKHAGLSQAALSRTTGINQSTISRIESDRVDPTASTLYYIAAGIGCSLSTLLTDTLSPRLESE